jgi:Zn-dependent protease
MVAVPLISLAVFGWPIGFASAPFSATWAAQHPRRAGWMSLAGPGANLALVLVCCFAIWIGVFIGAFQAPETANFTRVVASAADGGFGESAAFLVSVFFTLNLILFLFNLFPLPPLDGSGALPLILPARAASRIREIFARPMFSFFGLLIAWNLFGPIFNPVFTFALNLLYPGAGYH